MKAPSVVCTNGTHSRCRPTEWACSCTCHQPQGGETHVTTTRSAPAPTANCADANDTSNTPAAPPSAAGHTDPCDTSADRPHPRGASPAGGGIGGAGTGTTGPDTPHRKPTAAGPSTPKDDGPGAATPGTVSNEAGSPPQIGASQMTQPTAKTGLDKHGQPRPDIDSYHHARRHLLDFDTITVRRSHIRRLHEWDIHSLYVERWWTPIVGPTAMLALRALDRLVGHDTETHRISVVHLAAILGVGVQVLERALQRLVTFTPVYIDEDGTYRLPAQMPALGPGALSRLDPWQQAEHAGWVAETDAS